MGDITAAPATTGVVSVCMTSSARVTGAGTPGSRGADTEVGTAASTPAQLALGEQRPVGSGGAVSRGPSRAPSPAYAPCVTLLPPEPPRASVVSAGTPVDTPPSATAASHGTGGGEGEAQPLARPIGRSRDG